MPELPYGAAPVPATPIGDLKRWRLEIRCGKCRRAVTLPLEFLAGKYGGHVKIAAVIRRLRCARPGDGDRCGGNPSQVLCKFNVYGKSLRREQEIVVVDEAARP